MIVLSLGGSLIIPDKINKKLLEGFKKVLLGNCEDFKFVVVCGGGSTARNYINGLSNKNHQNMMGIASTRLNARFMMYFFKDFCNK